MPLSTKDHWNNSHLKHPKDREPSNYAKDKELLFPRNAVICDLGGGDGTDSIYFINRGHRVYLYDISDLALNRAMEKAKEKNVAKNLSTGELDLGKDNIPCTNEFFDVVYARLSLHYFYLERMVEILKDIFRILKKEGVAYLAVKSPDDKTEMEWLENNNEKVSDGIYREGNLIKTRFNKTQYKTMLEKAGIKNYAVNDYIERFGKERVFLKSKADKLQYIEIIIHK